eukprot:scaffold25469_cov131-Isochrysis_galbana.AAC.2
MPHPIGMIAIQEDNIALPFDFMDVLGQQLVRVAPVQRETLLTKGFLHQTMSRDAVVELHGVKHGCSDIRVRQQHSRQAVTTVKADFAVMLDVLSLD